MTTNQHVVPSEWAPRRHRCFPCDLVRLAFRQMRIASRKSSFVRFKHLFSSNSVLVSPSGPLLRSSALKLEKHMAFVREKEEDSS